MKNSKKYDATEMCIEEQRVVDGGVAPDENGKGCTEHGIPDIFKNIGKTHKPTNEFLTGELA